MKSKFPDFKREKLYSIELKNKLPKKDRDVLEDYKKYCLISVNEKKANDIQTIIIQFRYVIEKQFDKITLRELRHYLGLLNSSGKEHSTQNTNRTWIKHFLKWKFKDWYVRFDEFKDAKNKTIRYNPKRINEGTLLDENKRELLIKTARDFGLKTEAIIVVSDELGCRPAELREAKIEQLDLNSVPEKITLYSSKTKKSRTLPLKYSTPVLKKWLRNYPFENYTKKDYLFPSREGANKPMNRNSWLHQIKKVGKKCGLDIHGYIIRHSKLTEIRRKGMQESKALLFGGHEIDSKMGGVYTHLNSDDLVDEVLSKLYSEENISPGVVKQLKDKMAKMERHIRELKKDNVEIHAEMQSNLDEESKELLNRLIRNTKKDFDIFKKGKLAMEKAGKDVSPKAMEKMIGAE